MKRISAAFSVFLLSSSLLFGQAPSFNSIYWGAYFEDSLNFPGYNFSKSDLIDQVAVDRSTGDIYVVGQSFAPPLNSSLALCGGTQSVVTGGGNGYLAKFNHCGELQWSTYLGEKTLCLALGIENGKRIIYVAGNIKLEDVPGGPAFACDGNPEGLYQTSNVDFSDGFIAKYQDNGTSVEMLRWTFFGGTKPDALSGADNIWSMAVYNNDVFIVGSTSSIDLGKDAVNVGDTTLNEGADEGFLAQFDNMLSTLKFFTYIGGEGSDRFHDIQILPLKIGRFVLFLSGTTESTTGIASGTGFDQTFNGIEDAFVQRWEDKDGDGVITQTWGTYMGGSKDEHSRVSKLDRKGDLLLTGFTRSNDLPVTPLAYDPLFGENGDSNNVSDAYVFKVTKDGELVWCTYFGSGKDEGVNGLTVMRRQGKQYVAIAGLTRGNDETFPLVNSMIEELNGNNSNLYEDAYLAVFTDGSGPQQLVQSTLIGGSLDEGIQAGKSYHPSIALGPQNEIYMVFATESPDINSVVGSEFQNLTSPYNGGGDAFIAKLIDSTNLNQANCNFLKKDWAESDEIEEAKIYLYPVPATDHITISAYNPGDELDVEIVISNVIHQAVVAVPALMVPGSNAIPVSLQSLPPGFYTLHLHIGDRLVSRKFVIH